MFGGPCDDTFGGFCDDYDSATELIAEGDDTTWGVYLLFGEIETTYDTCPPSAP